MKSKNQIRKENENLHFIFQTYLRQLIALRPDFEPTQIKLYDFNNLNQATKDDLMAKVKNAMILPKTTYAYQDVLTIVQDPKKADTLVWDYVEIRGLIVLGLLGDETVIPHLISYLRRNPRHTRFREISSAVLLHLTGENIGNYLMTEHDLDLWDEWWEKKKSSSL
jgi:hypothetical protein